MKDVGREELVQKCQENPWLKRGGIPFEDDPPMELDYGYVFTEVQTVEQLVERLSQGNWAIRQGFVYKNLALINQVNGGDEWWAVRKLPDGRLQAFESISFERAIERGHFSDGETVGAYIERLRQLPGKEAG
jgi:hypothetical protein